MKRKEVRDWSAPRVQWCVAKLSERKPKLRQTKELIPNMTNPHFLHKIPKIFLVCIGVFGPRIQQALPELPALIRKKKKSLCLSLKFSNEEQTDRYKSERKITSSQCLNTNPKFEFFNFPAYSEKKITKNQTFKCMLNKSTKNNLNVFQNLPFMKNSLYFTKEKSLKKTPSFE